MPLSRFSLSLSPQLTQLLESLEAASELAAGQMCDALLDVNLAKDVDLAPFCADPAQHGDVLELMLKRLSTEQLESSPAQTLARSDLISDLISDFKTQITSANVGTLGEKLHRKFELGGIRASAKDHFDRIMSDLYEIAINGKTVKGLEHIDPDLAARWFVMAARAKFSGQRHSTWLSSATSVLRPLIDAEGLIVDKQTEARLLDEALGVGYTWAVQLCFLGLYDAQTCIYYFDATYGTPFHNDKPLAKPIKEMLFVAIPTIDFVHERSDVVRVLLDLARSSTSIDMGHVLACLLIPNHAGVCVCVCVYV